MTSPLAATILRAEYDKAINLLSSGHPVDGEPGDRITPLIAILERIYAVGPTPETSKCVDALINARANVNNSLVKACGLGKTYVAQALIQEHDANIHAVCEDTMAFYQYSPLMAAAACANSLTVSFLINQHVDINASFRLSGHNTALHLAAKNGNLFVVANLIKAGARCNELNLNRQTPLHLAAEHGKAEIVATLIFQPNIVIDALDIRGNTPLFLALRHSITPETVSHLLNANASVEGTNNNGETALQRAIASYTCENLALLLNTGKVKFTPDNHFCLAELKSAINAPDSGVVKLLLNAGADKSTQDPICYKLLKDMAKRSGVLSIQIYLKEAKEKNIPAVSKLVNFAFEMSKTVRIDESSAKPLKPKL